MYKAKTHARIRFGNNKYWHHINNNAVKNVLLSELSKTRYPMLRVYKFVCHRPGLRPVWPGFLKSLLCSNVCACVPTFEAINN